MHMWFCFLTQHHKCAAGNNNIGRGPGGSSGSNGNRVQGGAGGNGGNNNGNVANGGSGNSGDFSGNGGIAAGNNGNGGNGGVGIGGESFHSAELQMFFLSIWLSPAGVTNTAVLPAVVLLLVHLFL